MWVTLCYKLGVKTITVMNVLNLNEIKLQNSINNSK